MKWDEVNFNMIFLQLTIILGYLITESKPTRWTGLNLPEEHIPYYFNNNKQLKKLCNEDDQCPYKKYTSTQKCWGYEKNCREVDRMSMPSCPEDSRAWAKTKADQLTMFWKQGDFGYVSERKSELMDLCQPQSKGDSSLRCTKYARYCEVKNLYIDFKNLRSEKFSEKFRENIFSKGEIGGKCKMDRRKLAEQSMHKSALQSWYAEMEQFDALDFNPSKKKNCDISYDKPVIFIKLDAGVNMYHHFCDFINIYASQHMNNSFSTDIHIVMWDTSYTGYGDFFSDTWKAFTDYPVIHLKDFDGKKVCFKSGMFSLLARMRSGLYYNMPLVPGCYGTSLFRAFSQHVLHRLDVEQTGPLKSKIRITLLSRSTKYRKFLNQEELVSAMKSVGEYEVNVVDYNWRTFKFPDQLRSTHNSDIFIGMHGSGLTHGLFLPDWGVLFEAYNCDDANCYKDLARLRGVKYMTWENIDKLDQEDEGHHPQLGAHKKFTNYAFDVREFMRMVHNAADHVRNHPSFIEARNHKYSEDTKDEL
ncbi:unnamed protein product [Owenia fusiformis]|uniref:EGF domain-specific O-linked N-acetylglucosamine transferase n=1 Tax=Owenia fusiformis TaxID=6347 RepID=A0A8J1T5R1_OWEFU|nr:unnamed protein product [Owenia fusiformis]